MADEKLTQQTADTTPALTDITYGVKDPGGTPLSRKLTWQTVWNLLTSLTAKTSLVDADQFSISDSAASNATKKITWANLLIALRKVFHTLTTTATAAGTTTLTVSSDRKQYFTGTTTQTIVMPVVSTLSLGDEFVVLNDSTGILTVNSSGSNLIKSVQPGTTLVLTCILVTGTTAASWKIESFDPAIAINNAVAKTTPVDADRFGFWDSVSGFLNHVTWANLKATLGTATTFLPTVIGTGTAGVGTYTTQLGKYARIGSVIWFEINLVWTAQDGAGNMRLDGLPVASANDSINVPLSIYFSDITLGAVGNKLQAHVLTNSTQIIFTEVGSGAATAVALDTAGTIRLAGFYFV